MLPQEISLCQWIFRFQTKLPQCVEQIRNITPGIVFTLKTKHAHCTEQYPVYWWELDIILDKLSSVEKRQLFQHRGEQTDLNINGHIYLQTCSWKVNVPWLQSKTLPHTCSGQQIKLTAKKSVRCPMLNWWLTLWFQGHNNDLEKKPCRASSGLRFCAFLNGLIL